MIGSCGEARHTAVVAAAGGERGHALELLLLVGIYSGIDLKTGLARAGNAPVLVGFCALSGRRRVAVFAGTQRHGAIAVIDV